MDASHSDPWAWRSCDPASLLWTLPRPSAMNCSARTRQRTTDVVSQGRRITEVSSLNSVTYVRWNHLYEYSWVFMDSVGVDAIIMLLQGYANATSVECKHITCRKQRFLYLLLIRYSAAACFTPDATTDRLNLKAKGVFLHVSKCEDSQAPCLNHFAQH